MSKVKVVEGNFTEFFAGRKWGSKVSMPNQCFHGMVRKGGECLHRKDEKICDNKICKGVNDGN